jgi:NAD(P)-dependent dehydrogenase (short-subunit alcohol dehydrogenase family)
MKRFLVTGATSGVGLAVGEALVLQREAVDVVGRDAQKLDRHFGPIGCEHPGTEIVIDFEASLPHEVSQSVKSWAEIGGAYDGIFHAAGAELVLPLRLTDDAKYRKAMTFADSTFAILRAAASKGVMKDGGSVVLMSSVAAHRGTAGMAAYSAARAAVEAMARCAAGELSQRRIRVNCVAAGAFGSALHERVLARMPESARQGYEDAHPLGFGTVEAVRDAVLHLLGPQSAWTTGTTVVVDGGYLNA